MSHRLLAVMLASLALIAGGCGSGEPEATEGETPSPEPTPGATSAVPTQSLATKPNEPVQTSKKAPSASAGLISSTNSDERAQQVQSQINAGRNSQTVAQGDPFGPLLVPPARVKLPEAPEGAAGTADGGVVGTETNGGSITGTTDASGTTVASGGGTGTSGGSGTGKTVASLPPLPAITAQVADPVSDIPTLFVPPIFSPSTGSIISASAGGSGGGGGVPSSPSRGGGGSTSSPSQGGGGSTSSPSEQIPPVASLPELPPLPTEIGPAIPPEEPVASLPPLDGGPVAQLPPLPTEIGPAIPPAPVEPPAVAETITITGVVQVGNEIQVIVQLPGSSTGRYVKVGELIADGKVRIKRVDGIQSSNPIVILEEEGVEYARAVGDAPMLAMEEPDRG